MNGNNLQNWVYRFVFPDGEVTDGPQNKGRKNRFKAECIQELDLSGKRVLDLGCADGMFSFYMAQEGAQVVGIDLLPDRIERANYAKDKLGLRNVSFQCKDLNDPKILEDLGKFDFVFCFAIIHRVSDPFRFLSMVTSISDTIILEWKSPSFFLNKNISLAFHETTGKLDPKNVYIKESLSEVNNISDTSDARPYWTLSKGAVENILDSFGFRYFRSKQVEKRNILRDFISATIFVMKCTFYKKPFCWGRYTRTLMIASRTKLKVVTPKLASVRQHIWDGTDFTI